MSKVPATNSNQQQQQAAPAQSGASSPLQNQPTKQPRIPFTEIPDSQKAYPRNSHPTTGSIESAIRSTLPPKPQRRYGFSLGLGKTGSIIQLSFALFVGVGAALFLANAMVVYDKEEYIRKLLDERKRLREELKPLSAP
ncbi:hypothetical protein SmJEL517_g00389 [Synchytrium microbalum]|uniref:Uncharacterized protein n=1 Tax=Synchytrium microbalum TaxID=1806994 RepID=A0A507CF35_9FUNG|nr:uncharacterized protein SmJEL517_g00389 [Synchytrium microbalum]TPX38242.1 hypothetical protein SmJEL517_g00389 [Synchytrium microbalum]